MGWHDLWDGGNGLGGLLLGTSLQVGAASAECASEQNHEKGAKKMFRRKMVKVLGLSIHEGSIWKIKNGSQLRSSFYRLGKFLTFPAKRMAQKPIPQILPECKNWARGLPRAPRRNTIPVRSCLPPLRHQPV